MFEGLSASIRWKKFLRWHRMFEGLSASIRWKKFLRWHRHAVSISSHARSLSRQPQNCLTGRFADSQTDGLELLSPCSDSPIALRHCADSRFGKHMGRGNADLGRCVSLNCSRGRARFAGDLENWVRCVADRSPEDFFFPSPGLLQTKPKVTVLKKFHKQNSRPNLFSNCLCRLRGRRSPRSGLPT